jgi:hypothetical protein
MKRNKIALLMFFTFGIFVFLAVAKSMTRDQDYMSLSDAQKKWGHRTFSIESFKSGSISDRASMAVSLVEHKAQFLGKTPKDIRKMLGGFTGYFWSERVPTYIIEEGWKNKKDTWQLVFLLSSDSAVDDVKIHKNCCDSDTDQKRLKELDQMQKSLNSVKSPQDQSK